jgi:hypothetical protein
VAWQWRGGSNTSVLMRWWGAFWWFIWRIWSIIERDMENLSFLWEKVEVASCGLGDSGSESGSGGVAVGPVCLAWHGEHFGGLFGEFGALLSEI